MPSTSPPAGSAASYLAVLAEVARIATQDLALRPMLQRITDTLAARFDWDLVGLVKVETEHFVCEALSTRLPTEVHIGYRRPLGSGVVGQVAVTGKPLLIDDAQGFPNFVHNVSGVRSEICVPIRHRGELVGLLNVESRELAAFHDQLPLLEAIAEQIAGAIANARLHERVNLRVTAFEVLTAVSRQITGSGDLDARLSSVTAYLRERFDLTAAAVLIADPEGREWEHRAIASPLPERDLPNERWPTSVGVVGRAIRSGLPQLVLDVSRDPDYFGVLPGVSAELAVPLRFREQILGAMNFEAASAALFTPDAVQLFESVADQIAGAIELAVVNQRLAISERELAAAAERLTAVNDQLLRLTLTDGLTGVANRRCFEDRLAEEWRRAQRLGTPVSLALIDVDHFKAYNDCFGHPTGDECLRTLAHILARGIGRAGELVARWGGEEFAAILPGAEAADARRYIDRIRKRVEAAEVPHPTSPTAPHVTLSAGVATEIPEMRRAPERLVERADQALYRAKRNGRNRVEPG